MGCRKLSEHVVWNESCSQWQFLRELEGGSTISQRTATVLTEKNPQAVHDPLVIF